MSKKILPKLIVIIGPTASGKTDLSVFLAKRFGGEIVSADSRQIYRGMDIGTGKDKSFPHHLIDIIEPTKIFSAADFKERALEIIKGTIKRGNLPILTGGTGLYVNSLLYNYDFKQQRGEKIFNSLIIGITWPRKKIVERIEQRVDEQIKQGLIEEVRALVEKYGDKAHALQNTIAYQELLPYLQGEITLEKAVEEIKKDTRRYAKRQMTWFKKMDSTSSPQEKIHWIVDKKQAIKLIQEFLLGDVVTK
jgi:tRNA dimethylallyltransferase